MEAGKLRHRISVYQKVTVSDGCGGQDVTYTLKGSCWCAIAVDDPAKNDERYTDRKIKTVNGLSIKTRFNIGFTFLQTDVIFFDGRLFRIQGISNILEHDFRFSVYCYEIENDSVVTA